MAEAIIGRIVNGFNLEINDVVEGKTISHKRALFERVRSLIVNNDSSLSPTFDETDKSQNNIKVKLSTNSAHISPVLQDQIKTHFGDCSVVKCNNDLSILVPLTKNNPIQSKKNKQENQEQSIYSEIIMLFFWCLASFYIIKNYYYY
jgi:hypothetical protein